MNDRNPLIMALPKGRIAEELTPLMAKLDIIPEDAFFDKKSRLLRFRTNNENLDLIRVRSFDVATFVAFGAASLGVAGSDVLMEFDNPEIYAPLNLNIAHCRLSVAEKAELAESDDPKSWSHIHVATKYPNITKKYFSKRGVQAECIKLNGAMELAPALDLCPRIVDLVSTGKTLKENGLKEVEVIAEVSSYLVANRTALKTRQEEVTALISGFQEAVSGENN